MMTTTIGLDLAKSVFQVHGVSSEGQVTVRRKLRRSELMRFFRDLPPCLIGMEACATAHYWARELSALGHEVRLMPPSYVKAYLRRQKNDAADAEAICEAVTRPTMRFVPVKSAERQAILTLHRTRELLVRQKTTLIRAIRSHCAEFGLVVPQGARRITDLLQLVRETHPSTLPQAAVLTMQMLGAQLDALAVQIRTLERRLLAWHRENETSQRLATIPGVGIITSTALAASISDPKLFKSGREFAAFLGLVPRQNSSGGKERLGQISKKGDGYLRKLLVVGATSVIRRARTGVTPSAGWVQALLERRPSRVVTVAMANKTARIAWAVMARGETYRPIAKV
ncbi:IS110 family transposase [Brevundimonas vancanneytii]|uniref:Transposase IS116/IS110/IS902 family n=2 Tax=Brevundimonas vancanneytii TaxID=1325724 RepID=A0A4P1K8R9_9CAUL|nr:IS110 family transposase [Brevundimonas vancanneytii]VTO16807.1 Transposase IS116/IS110/IS902 family [Brevundimonas vancanneytii]VTO17872.1 Transposase IS116/IS110/IS902 family [Brevundimonas vancanneytii]